MGARRLAGWTAAVLLALPATAHAAPASPDPGFGSGGTVVGGVDGHAPQAVGMLLDREGRPVMAARTGGAQLSAMRMAPNGALERAMTTSLAGATDSLLTDVIQLPDGAYAIGGWIQQAGERHLALVRYNAAGQLVQAPDAGIGETRALAVAGDGRIVAAGRSGETIAIVRYAADGTSPERSTLDLPGVGSEEASGLVVEPSGRIVLAGTASFDGKRQFMVVPLDLSFGPVLLDVGGSATVNSLERQPDGKLLVGGTGGGSGVVARFLPSGVPDAGWGANGIARVPGAVVEDVALQPDGKVVAVGSVDGADSIVARFRPGGALDPGFGTDGVLRRSLGSAGRDELTGVGIAADGGIVAGGLAPGAAVLTRLVGGDSSDPALAMTAESLGDFVSFTLTATNPGADAARDVSVSVAPPAGAAATALATAGGACAGMVCSLGTLPAGATKRMTLFARAKRPGALSASARIAGATFDSDAGNNAAGATATATRNRGRRDRIRPRVVMTLKAKRIRDVRKRVKLAVRTSEAATVVVWASHRKRGRSEKLTSNRTVKLRKAGTKSVRLALTKTARKLVKRKKTRRLALVVTARARDKAGNARTRTLRATLRR
jgi:uncharacterized delta-60 repeat protein